MITCIVDQSHVRRTTLSAIIMADTRLDNYNYVDINTSLLTNIT